VLSPRAVEPAMGRLEPTVKRVWRAHGALWWVPIGLGALAYDVVHLFRPGVPFPFAATVAVALVATVIVGALPALRFRFWRYAATEEALFVEYGWFTRVRTVVPLRRIQHIDVAESLFEREEGLARLVVHTAGTRNNTVVVPGLLRERAEALRDAMRDYLADDPL
jgi:uncharacterized protein